MCHRKIKSIYLRAGRAGNTVSILSVSSFMSLRCNSLRLSRPEKSLTHASLIGFPFSFKTRRAGISRICFNDVRHVTTAANADKRL